METNGRFSSGTKWRQILVRLFQMLTISGCLTECIGGDGERAEGRSQALLDDDEGLREAETPPLASRLQANWFDNVARTIAAEEYNPSISGGSLQAPNRRAGVRYRFLSTGVSAEPRVAGADQFMIQLRTAAIGRAGERLTDLADAEPSLEAHIVHYRRDFGVHETFENLERGLKHSLVLSEAPRGSGPVEIAVSLTGAEDIVCESADRVVFRAADSSRTYEYSGLAVHDANNVEVEARLSATLGAITISLDDQNHNYPITIDPYLTISGWSIPGEPDSLLGSSDGVPTATTAGDVDGDGYSDVIIGVPFWDGGGAESGKVMLFRGSAQGPAANPVWELENQRANEMTGYAVSTAGDVNGDGRDDILVGSPGYDLDQNHDVGIVQLFLGSADPLQGVEPQEAWSREGSAMEFFGHSVAMAGDVNGDGLSDVIIGATGHICLGEDPGGEIDPQASGAGNVPSPVELVNV